MAAKTRKRDLQMADILNAIWMLNGWQEALIRSALQRAEQRPVRKRAAAGKAARKPSRAKRPGR